MAAAIVSPSSRGNVTINSTDASILPLVSPNWLTDPADIDLAIQALKRLRAIWQSREMSGVTLGDEFEPGMSVTTDAEIEHYIRETAIPVYHVSCTCKMGVSGDAMVVADLKARVWGKVLESG